MKFEVHRHYRFEAAHRLDWHQGACANLHGHSYKLEVVVTGRLDEREVVADFADIDAVVEPVVLARYDHTFLNDVVENPTCERVAAEIYTGLTQAGLDVVAVRLWETESGSVTVSER